MKKHKKILMSDPLVSAMNVQASQEKFVDLLNFDSEIKVDRALSNRSQYFSYVRQSVANKLHSAKKFLPNGYRFLIKEGYRPVHVQALAFERSLERVREKSANQDINYIIAEASKYVAPPQVAPHPTGGAIDLTLIDSVGNELDLGTPFDAIPEDTDNATFFDAANISQLAFQNRQILANALQPVGFINYFSEWWHWSYGDKYWAVMTNASHALYNPVSEEELLRLLR